MLCAIPLSTSSISLFSPTLFCILFLPFKHCLRLLLQLLTHLPAPQMFSLHAQVLPPQSDQQALKYIPYSNPVPITGFISDLLFSPYLLLHLLDLFHRAPAHRLVVESDAGERVWRARCLTLLLACPASHLLLFLLLCLLQLALGVDAVRVVQVVRLHHLTGRTKKSMSKSHV